MSRYKLKNIEHHSYWIDMTRTRTPATQYHQDTYRNGQDELFVAKTRNLVEPIRRTGVRNIRHLIGRWEFFQRNFGIHLQKFKHDK
jgi:hypothetical protein